MAVPFGPDTAADRDLVDDSLRHVGVEHLAGRQFASLSGGEKQRVLVARALAQQTRVLVLDEPTNNLDIRHQLELLELISDFELTTIAALHDLNLAANYCDRRYVLSQGTVVADGPPDAVLTSDLLQNVVGVGVHVHVVDNPRTERPHLIFHPLPDQL